MKTDILALIVFFMMGFNLCVPVVQKQFEMSTIIVKADPLGAGDWWNNDWQNSKRCNITNKLDDYQMKIIVGNSTGGDVTCDGHIGQSNFTDIRFVNYDNTSELYHWMENYTADGQATFWVNNSENTSYIWMYYNNGSCGNTSFKNGTKTFDFFDDFAGTSMNSSKWHEKTSVNIDWTNPGYVEMTDDGAISSNAVWGADVRGRTQAWCNEQDTIFLRLMNDSDSDDRITIMNSDTYSPEDFDEITLLTFENSVKTQTDKTILDIRYNRTYAFNWTSTYVRGYMNDTLIGYHTTNIPNEANLNLIQQVFDSSQESTMRVYWTFLAKYKATEPTWDSFGSEQTAPGWSNTAPTFSNPIPLNQSTAISLTPTVNVTVTDADGNQLICNFYTSLNNVDWTWRQTNSSVLNESIEYDYTQASGYDTLYYWKVTANDTHDNSSVAYHFTTRTEPFDDTDWPYNITLPINYTIEGEQDNYPMKLHINYSGTTNNPGYVELNGHCNNNFSDIRFSDWDGYEFDHWIQEKIDGSNCTVWVEVLTINSSGQTNITIHYGNSSATSESNADNAGITYNNFEQYPSYVFASSDSEEIGTNTMLSYENVTYLFEHYYCIDNGSTESFLWSSDDNGSTWTNLGSPWAYNAGHNYHDIGIINGTDKILMVAGLFGDAALSWTVYDIGDTTFDTHLNDISVDGGSVDVTCLGYNSSVWYVFYGRYDQYIECRMTNDSGSTWYDIGYAVTTKGASSERNEDTQSLLLNNDTILLGWEDEDDGGNDASKCKFGIVQGDDTISWGTETVLENFVADAEGCNFIQWADDELWAYWDTDRISDKPTQTNNFGAWMVFYSIFNATSGNWGVASPLFYEIGHCSESGFVPLWNDDYFMFGSYTRTGASGFPYNNYVAFIPRNISIQNLSIGDELWCSRSAMLPMEKDGSNTLWSQGCALDSVSSITVINSTSSDYAFTTRIKANNSNKEMRIVLRYSDNDDYYYIMSDSSGYIYLYEYDTSSVQLNKSISTVSGWSDSIWYNISARVETDSTTAHFMVYVDDVLMLEHNDTSVSQSTGGTGVSSGYSSGEHPVYSDNWMFRKWVSPEPTWGTPLISKEWVVLDTWNLTLSNTTQPYTLDCWNLTLSNLTISPYVLDTWNLTLSNLTISPFTIDTWNVTLSNTTIMDGDILDTWNLTIGNMTISPFIIDTWNVTLSNTTIIDGDILDTWNLTIGNMSISPFTIDTWNITLSNTPLPYILDTWNVTLSNTTVGEILDRWNVTLSNTSFFLITDVTATPSEAVIDDIDINITCNVTSLHAIVNVTVNMTEGTYDMANIGDLYYYVAVDSTIGIHYYHIYANDTSGDQLESATYSFEIIGLSCSFTYTVKGGIMTLTPTITGATHYRWTLTNETGVRGQTPWIPIGDIADYIQGYVYPTTIRALLSAKNIHFNQYANYSDKIRIAKSSFDKPEPTIEEPTPEPTNIFKDIKDAVVKWFSERNTGEILFMVVMSIILAVAIMMKKYPQKKIVYQVLKKKKKEK